MYMASRDADAHLLALRPEPDRRASAARDPGRDGGFRLPGRRRRSSLFITATNVRTGTGRVFRNAEITPDVLLASACLPTMFQAVEIDGELYWDGGYVGNPTITPLVRECRLARHDPGADQPDRARRGAEDGARHHEPPQRGGLQRAAAQGTAHDRAAAQGGRPGPRRRRAVGRHAHPPHRHRPRDRARLDLEDDHRMALPVRAARRRAAHAPSCSSTRMRDDLGKRSTLDLDAMLRRRC